MFYVSSYLGVRVPAYNETDWSRATFTEDSIGLTESGVTKTDWVHLQYLISSTARRSIGVSTTLSKNLSLYIPLHKCTHIQYVRMTNEWFTNTCYNQRAHMIVWTFGIFASERLHYIYFTCVYQLKDDPEVFTWACRPSWPQSPVPDYGCRCQEQNSPGSDSKLQSPDQRQALKRKIDIHN